MTRPEAQDCHRRVETWRIQARTERKTSPASASICFLPYLPYLRPFSGCRRACFVSLLRNEKDRLPRPSSDRDA
jgi:hypothetical protein